MHNFSFLLQTSQTHRIVYIKLIVTWKPSCFSLATNVAVTAFLAPYWMLIHTWSYQTSQWLLASGDRIKTNGSTVQYTHFTTWWSKHRSAMSLKEKGRKYLKEVWRTRPLDLNISCPTNGKEAMINTLRWEQLGALRSMIKGYLMGISCIRRYVCLGNILFQFDCTKHFYRIFAYNIYFVNNAIQCLNKLENYQI